MTRMIAACFLLSAVCLGFAACGGDRIRAANIDVVNHQLDLVEKSDRSGVSPKEVESILGPPTRTETKMLPLETQKKEVEVVRYFYEQDGKTVALIFTTTSSSPGVPYFGETPPQPGAELKMKQP